MKTVHIVLMMFVVGMMLNGGDVSAQRQGDDDTSDTDGSSYCDYIRDGRVNDDPQRSCAAPVIIYMDPLRVYAINPETNRSVLVLTVDDDEITAAGVPEDENITLAEDTDPFSGYPIIVSRLTTGEFQVNAFYPNGEGYVVIWEVSGAHSAYTYYPSVPAANSADADTGGDDGPVTDAPANPSPRLGGLTGGD